MKVESFLKYNRHWEKGFKYPFGKKRKVLKELIKSVSSRQILELAGLRRTGKTTLFFQIINNLVETDTNPFSIWYFTFDEEKPDLDKLLNEFVLQTSIDFRKEKVFVFLDEIQKLDNFQAKLKVYYDLYPNIKFFISGSTSLFIKKKTQESLAGRLKSFFLTPLHFKEYLHFKDTLEILDKPLIFQDRINLEFANFLKSQFIESIEMNSEKDKKEYLVSIVKKITFEDIPQIFPVENPEVLWRIICIIAQNPGIFINYRNLSSNLGISSKTISLYLYYLEESFLIKKIYNFSRNLITSEKKLKRFYLASPSFSWAIADFVPIGNLVENFVISLKDYKFFWRDAYGHEVDFIDVKLDNILPIEVKYRNKINKKNFKNLKLFCRKFGVSNAISLEKSYENKRLSMENLEINRKSVFDDF
jgi:uncharacterized protein